MSQPSLLRTLVYTIPSIVGVLLCLVLVVALIRRQSWLLFFFLGFYVISVAHLAGGLVTRTLNVTRFWTAGLVVSRLRWVFLILFVHAAHRFRATPLLTAILLVIVAVGVVSPLLVYSLIPQVVSIVVVLYAFAYWLTVYLSRRRLSLSPRRLGLLRAVLICSGFFLTGLVLDLLEGIPQAGVYVSVLLFDFHPFYLVTIGAVMAFWALRDHHPGPAQAREAGPRELPVTRREGEVIDLILRGETNASIAAELFISESTVKKHVNNIFRKLGITSRWELLKVTRGDSPKGVGVEG